MTNVVLEVRLAISRYVVSRKLPFGWMKPSLGVHEKNDLSTKSSEYENCLFASSSFSR